MSRNAGHLSLSVSRAQAGVFAGLALALAAVSISAPGCGDPNATGTLKVHPVTGKVLLSDGTPLKAGQVVLVSSEKAMEFSGAIQSDGTFSIKTSQGDGAPEGAYKVRIDPDASGTAKGKAGKRSAASLPFPAEYADESTSPLKVTIKSGDNTLEPFKLTPSAAGSGKEKHSDRRG